MVQVYLDSDGGVRSSTSGRLIAPAGTTSAAARMQARLWAAAASALTHTTAEPRPVDRLASVVTPISAAPNYQSTSPLTVIDVRRLHDETAESLATLTASDRKDFSS